MAEMGSGAALSPNGAKRRLFDPGVPKADRLQAAPTPPSQVVAMREHVLGSVLLPNTLKGYLRLRTG